jgi:hypothetical protein
MDTAPVRPLSVLGGEQDSLAEQRQPGPPEHLPLDHFDVSVESGLSLLSVFVLPRTDDRQMTLSLGQTQSSNGEEVGGRKRLVCPLSEVAGSRSVVRALVIKPSQLPGLIPRN